MPTDRAARDADNVDERPHPSSRPTLAALGGDLLQVSKPRLLVTLSAPFVCMAAFALFAWLGWWPLAVLSIMGLSFITYGSTSHDLVHRTLKLPRGLNDSLLSLIEWLSLRSGTAYRLSHLHHHAHLLAPDDVEGASAHGGFWCAVATGPTLQARLWLWAWRTHPEMRVRLAVEAAGILGLIALAVACTAWSWAPLAYVTLVIAGSWVFPLVTVYFPHDARGEGALRKTRIFRSRVIQFLAFGHLYHLEHHMYPGVPHHHWKTLADRLDPYFEQEGIRPYDVSPR